MVPFTGNVAVSTTKHRLCLGRSARLYKLFPMGRAESFSPAHTGSATDGMLTVRSKVESHLGVNPVFGETLTVRIGSKVLQQQIDVVSSRSLGLV